MKDLISTRKTIGAKLNAWSATASSLSQRYQWKALRRQLQRSQKPILCGPFLGEVGFEALYWIPWLSWLRDTLQIDPARMIPITRGGAGVWYGMPKAIEVYAMRSPQDVRVQNRLRHQRTGLMKQMAETDFDREIIADVAKTLEFKDYLVLYPKWMYQTLEPYWEGHRGFHWLAQQAHYRFPYPTPAIESKLPEKFVAVRFYARSTFPAQHDTTEMAKASVRTLAKNFPVLLLNSGLHTDDHVDLDISGDNIVKLSDLCSLTPENNLAAISAVMAKSMGFVGTYGGLAQLGLCLGKPSVSFYQDWSGTAIPHRHLATDLSLRSGIPFLVQRISDIGLLNTVLPTVVTTTGSVPLAPQAQAV